MPSQTVRTAAEQAGRDPASVRIWSCYATIPDTIPDDLRLKKTVGRLATYLQGYGDLLVQHERLGPRRAGALPRRCGRAVGAGRDRRRGRHPTLEHIATLLPDEWLEPSANGSAETCAQRVLRQFDLGVDGVIMHGATPPSSHRSSTRTARSARPAASTR